jgi:hypothetical protein
MKMKMSGSAGCDGATIGESDGDGLKGGWMSRRGWSTISRSHCEKMASATCVGDE